MMEKLDPKTDGATPDIMRQNIEQLKTLFPDLITEGESGAAINVDVLKALVGDQTITDCDEKYGLNWHGKRAARQLALTPSTGTLRPCPEDSVDWETTQNLMIEGDNLEVLKLLQKSYAGRVKLIYIDPPYNTGSDFVYPDDFRDSIRNYMELTGQVEGTAKVSSNTEASGRFHTDWLNMMYPRLKLARNLLSDDGVICISIDEFEEHNLRIVANEVFGEENLVEAMVWKRRYGGGAKEKHLVSIHEYVLVYAREKAALGELFVDLSREQVERYYKLQDEKYETLGPYRLQPLQPAKSMADRPNLRFPITAPDGTELWPRRQWLWGRERFQEAIERDELAFSMKDGSWTVNRKQYLRDPDGTERLTKQASIVDGVYGQQGSSEVDAIFGESGVFLFPKPTGLVALLLQLFARDGTVLDFFAGSGTTGHAVMAQNVSDKGNRRFVLVQLPELLTPDRREQKIAAEFCDALGRPRNIAEITKERLRRAAKNIKDENPMFAGDLGFRALKLDSTNIQEWEPDRERIAETLEESVEHLKENRTEDDILYELLLKLGLDLCVPIQAKVFAEKTVRSVGAGTLFVCLTEQISQEDAEQLAQGIVNWRAELAPSSESTVVFRDSAFADDVAKSNLAAILEQHGIENVRSL